jgi:hypothetical protein
MLMQHKCTFDGFLIFAVVVMKSCAFWDVMLRNLTSTSLLENVFPLYSMWEGKKRHEAHKAKAQKIELFIHLD